MLPHELEPFEVDKGHNRKIKIGDDIALTFTVKRNNKNEVTINPYKTTIQGKDGERYFGYDVIGTPKVYLRLTKGRRDKKILLGEFQLC